MRNLLGILALAMAMLVACDPLLGEPTPTVSLAPSLAPSATVLPIISPQSPDSFLGRSDPTAAALAAEGQPSLEPSLPINPTEVFIPITVVADDGTILQGSYFGAPVRPAPTLLLLHGEELNLSSRLATDLQAGGYNVLMLNQRGYPPSSGQVDWLMGGADARAALETLQTLPDVSSVGVVAQGRSAVAGVQACRQVLNCRAMVMIDPLPDDELIPFADLPILVGELPLLLIAGDERLISLDMAQRLAGAGLPATSLQVYTGLSFEEAAGSLALIQWLGENLSMGIEP